MTEKQRSDHPGLARVIEKQMRNWEIARAQKCPGAARPCEEVCPFVTIANIVGAGGNEVAVLLSEELHWPLFDRGLLTAMARDDEAREILYRSVDERSLGWFESIFRSLTQEEFRKDDYFHRLTETVLVLARQGPAVFVGRSADLILPRDRGLRIKVIASRERCVENFARRNETTLDQARREVDRIESDRHAFVRCHFTVDATEPSRFDLLVNVERFTSRQVVDLILAAMKLRGMI